MSQTVLLLFFTDTGRTETAQEIAKQAFNSTVILVMKDATGKPTTFGSGFFVRGGEIASNFHVIKGASSGYAKLPGDKTKYNIEGVVAVDLERDLVVLSVSASLSGALVIGDSDAVQVGEPVYTVGSPKGLEGTFSHGIVSSIRQFGDERLLQISAPISPGSSGGPVLNGKGEVIGVSVATFRDGQNLNFAIPSNYLKKLLAGRDGAGLESKVKLMDLGQASSKKSEGAGEKKNKGREATIPNRTPKNQSGQEAVGKDGAAMALIPEGEFIYGDAKLRFKLKAFYIDKYEVTVRQYTKFLNQTGSEMPTHWNSETPFKYGDRPVVGVDWMDASGYCKWAGKRLPTEEEWEKAARGADGRTYPWGEDSPTRLHANFGRNQGDGYEALLPVGKLEHGKSPYGIYDMAGNVAEWTSSNFLSGGTAAARMPAQEEFLKEVGPLNPQATRLQIIEYWEAYYSDPDMKVVRGGSWKKETRKTVVTDEIRTTYRTGLNRLDRNTIPHGFRCAKDGAY